MLDDLVWGWKGIAKLFDASESWCRAMARVHGMPVRRLGRRVYVEKREVSIWFDKLQHRAV